MEYCTLDVTHTSQPNHGSALQKSIYLKPTFSSWFYSAPFPLFNLGTSQSYFCCLITRVPRGELHNQSMWTGIYSMTELQGDLQRSRRGASTTQKQD